MHNLDINKFIKKICESKLDKKSNKIIKDLILDIKKDNDNVSLQILEMEKINTNFFKKSNCKNTVNDKFCTICQNNIKKGEHKVILCKCNHIFHRKCLNKYLKLEKINFSCPNCKYSYKNMLNKIAEESCSL